jgi:long-chain acyl-CoA synthetase
VTTLLVHHFLEGSAAAHPRREALVSGGERLTYAALEARAGRLRDALLARGVGRGERVAIHLGNSAATVIALFAALKAGAVFVVLDPLLTPGTLRSILDGCGAAALLTDGAAGIRCGTEAPSVRVLLLGEGAARQGVGPPAKPCWELRPLLEASAPPPARGAPVAVDERDVCGLIYTSGSTGAPKGVTVSHRNVTAAAGSILQYLAIDASDTVLNLLPLSSDYGLYNVLMPLWRGARVVLDRPFLQPHQLLAPLAREGVTGLPLTPTIVAILRRFRQLAPPAPERVRWITSTGQALAPAQSRWLQATFPAARIYSMYGLTECKRVAYLPPAELARRPTSVGKAIPGTAVHLVGEDGAEVRRPGAVGELVVRGPHVMQGYWNEPEATARVIEEGPTAGDRLLRTGDLFTTDEEGYLYFVGRRDDLIKSGGYLVSPRRVEAVAQELDGVCEAAAVAVAHEVLGRALRLTVVLAEGSTLTPETIRGHCERHLERYLVPREIEVREALPRTLAGKVDRRALAAAGAEPAARVERSA